MCQKCIFLFPRAHFLEATRAPTEPAHENVLRTPIFPPPTTHNVLMPQSSFEAILLSLSTCFYYHKIIFGNIIARAPGHHTSARVCCSMLANTQHAAINYYRRLSQLQPGPLIITADPLGLKTKSTLQHCVYCAQNNKIISVNTNIFSHKGFKDGEVKIKLFSLITNCSMSRLAHGAMHGISLRPGA